MNSKLQLLGFRGILHDERHFPDPFAFKPERWLPENHSTDTTVAKEGGTPPVDPWAVAFGYGRRICPGIPIARTSLWILMATMLSSFEIAKKIDPETGEEIVPQAEWTATGIVR